MFIIDQLSKKSLIIVAKDIRTRPNEFGSLTIKRPYKTTISYTRHAKSNEATHGDGCEKQTQDHLRPYKAIQGHTRSYKVIQGHTRPYKAICKAIKAMQGHARQTQQFNTIICHRI